jgi:hypothetical protein
VSVLWGPPGGGRSLTGWLTGGGRGLAVSQRCLPASWLSNGWLSLAGSPDVLPVLDGLVPQMVIRRVWSGWLAAGVADLTG